MSDEEWLPLEGDVHIRIWLSDTALDYTATVEAAHHLIQDWHRMCWCAIELIHDVLDGGHLPRLPCERLFLHP